MESRIQVRCKLLVSDAALPTKGSDGASGWDLYAYSPENPEMYLPPGERRLISTGLAFEIPEGFEGQIRPRSGLAHKEGIVTCFGTIDSDYRGNVAVNLFNHSFTARYVKHGQRIAQIVFQRVPQVDLIQADSLLSSGRGESGFGSTGR